MLSGLVSTAAEGLSISLSLQAVAGLPISLPAGAQVARLPAGAGDRATDRPVGKVELVVARGGGRATRSGPRGTARASRL